MEAILELLQSSYLFAVLSGLLLALVVGLFVTAFVQGREVSFWPPKVGPRPSADPGRSLKASPLTPQSPILDALIQSSLETVCRAVSLPETPQTARIRVFIFRKEEGWLVCRYHWAQDPVREQVGKLRFQTTAENAQRVAVVRAFRDERICRTAVTPLPTGSPGVAGDVDDSLTFVLAAPIFDSKGVAWGTVDFDAATENGKALLSTDVSDAVMHQLAKHLQIIFSFQNEGSWS
jgi:hypothetical protein